jgi:hypothetical protein
MPDRPLPNDAPDAVDDIVRGKARRLVDDENAIHEKDLVIW